MTKIKIEDTEVFKQVAKVIGKNRARIELFKVSKGWDGVDLEDISAGKNLFDCFSWGGSVQGYDFWDNIDEGINPYEK